MYTPDSIRPSLAREASAHGASYLMISLPDTKLHWTVRGNRRATSAWSQRYETNHKVKLINAFFDTWYPFYFPITLSKSESWWTITFPSTTETSVCLHSREIPRPYSLRKRMRAICANFWRDQCEDLTVTEGRPPTETAMGVSWSSYTLTSTIDAHFSCLELSRQM